MPITNDLCVQNAEKYLKQYTSGRLHEEAIVYLLSRGHTCEETIDKILDKYQRRRVCSRPYPASKNEFISFWRLVQWAKIGNNRNLWDKKIDISKWESNKILESLSFLDFKNPFFLFWSDIGIESHIIGLDHLLSEMQYMMKGGIRSYACKNLILRNTECKIPEPQVAYYCENLLKYPIAASFVFGHYRCPSNNIDKQVLQTCIDLLLEYQPDSENIHTGISLRSPCPDILVAMVIHALTLAKPFGMELTLQRSMEWLMNKQKSNGSWEGGREMSLQSTVFALDAIELARGGKQVTFQVEKPADQGTIQDSKVTTMAHGHPIIINLKGITQASRNFHKQKVTKKTVQPKKQSQIRVEWKDHENATFLINREQKIFFIYGEQDQIELKFKKAKHPQSLLLLFCQKDTRQAAEIVEILGGKDSASHRIRDVNTLIGKELRFRGFNQCPLGFEFFQSDKRGNYHAIIKVKTTGQYDREFIEKEGQSEHDAFANRSPKEDQKGSGYRNH